MKYVSFKFNGFDSYGALHKEMIYPAREIFPDAPENLVGFIESGNSITEDDIKKSGACPIEQSAVKILAPIPRPVREIICLGKNYADHANEVKATSSGDIPAHPVYFSKSAFSVIGNGDFIPTHDDVTKQIDYESELAVVIGKKCVNVPEENALEYIFGYTIINDITARDLQTKHGQWYLGKGLRGFCPMGPVIADKNEIKNPCDLKIKSRVNGETRQDSNTRNLIFNIAFIISQLSRGFYLYPGDIIATGTPAGVGHGFNPPKNLSRGDIVECEVEKIGVLTNTIGEDDE